MATASTWEDILRTNWCELLVEIDADMEFLSELQKVNIFTRMQIRGFSGIISSTTRVDTILILLRKMDFESFGQFCNALRNTNQENVIRDYLSFPKSFSANSADLESLQDAQDSLNVLTKNSSKLMANMAFDDALLTEIETRDLFTPIQLRNLHDKTEMERIELIIELLRIGSVRRFHGFCESLRACNQELIVEKYLSPVAK